LKQVTSCTRPSLRPTSPHPGGGGPAPRLGGLDSPSKAKNKPSSNLFPHTQDPPSSTSMSYHPLDGGGGIRQPWLVQLAAHFGRPRLDPLAREGMSGGGVLLRKAVRLFPTLSCVFLRYFFHRSFFLSITHLFPFRSSAVFLNPLCSRDGLAPMPNAHASFRFCPAGDFRGAIENHHSALRLFDKVPIPSFEKYTLLRISQGCKSINCILFRFPPSISKIQTNGVVFF